MADSTAELLSLSPCFCHDSDGRDPGQPDHRLPSRRTDTPMTSGRVTVYFAALLARTEDGWEASDTELDDVETLSDLTDLAREASVDEDTVLVFIEQEDAWFGVVRVDGEDDPESSSRTPPPPPVPRTGRSCSPTNCSAANPGPRTRLPPSKSSSASTTRRTATRTPPPTTTPPTQTPTTTMTTASTPTPYRPARSATPGSWPISDSPRPNC